LSKKENSLFRTMPLFRIILDILWRNPEGIYDRDLVEILREEHDIEASIDEIYTNLLKLEVNGLIYAERVGESLLLKPNIEGLKENNK